MDKGKRRVVIDPGHGGKDPGAVGLGLQEKEVVLHLAQHVRRALGGYEVDVLLTRETDEWVSLDERARRANEADADLFVSLHCNAGGGQGFESYVHPAAPERTRAIREVLHRRVMAFLASYGIRDRGQKEANFAVLRKTKMPAVLLENLFLDHPRENALLREEAFRKDLAQAIAAGIAQALGWRAAKPNRRVQGKTRRRRHLPRRRSPRRGRGMGARSRRVGEGQRVDDGVTRWDVSPQTTGDARGVGRRAVSHPWGSAG
nr:N-acetylmuramoyl-L-alanine amidase [Calditerricola satsumensis]